MTSHNSSPPETPGRDKPLLADRPQPSPGDRRCLMHEAPMPCPRCHVPLVGPTDLTPYAMCKGCDERKDDMGFCMCTAIAALGTANGSVFL